jgi:hypothetical protein
MNVQVVADVAGRVITASYPVSSSISDLSTFRFWGLSAHLDTGHDHRQGQPGYEHDHPTKKPKNCDPDPDRLAANRMLSGIRSVVERAIAPEEPEDPRHQLPRPTGRTPGVGTHDHPVGAVPH